MAYKYILKKWRQDPNASKRQIGTLSHWTSDSDSNNRPLSHGEVEQMKAYVLKYAPSTFYVSFGTLLRTVARRFCPLISQDPDGSYRLIRTGRCCESL